MDIKSLSTVAKSLVAPEKGIMAADESMGTIQKRFDSVGIENSEENRKSYRQMLFATAEIEKYLSGVILFDETIRDGASSKILQEKGIIPGIKVDTGKRDLADFPGETITEGLDGLTKRLEEYASLGAKFTKWRAAYKISSTTPSRWGMKANAHALARFAKDSQEAGLVPIVEPEVLMDGDHTIEKCEEVTTSVLKVVFSEILEAKVNLDGMLLKPNMVIHGEASAQKATPQEVAQASVRTLNKVVPAQIPGIVFLSGGQSSQEACLHLSLMNQLGQQPWQLSFSYGRALQAPALKAWSGKTENVESAQKEFLKRCRLTSLARQGKYSPEMEDDN